MKALALLRLLAGCSTMPTDSAGLPMGSAAQRYCLDYPEDALCR